ncbi:MULTISPECIES: MFS transporter [unclassified Azospirillum]|uniref:MFS transporter n=1 Tax=unclassified Azospirillum TaxID=2630922 RepID=UPI000D643E6B|nr:MULTISPECIES: MFS transporter [unclassified Azospirillum]
MEIEMTCLANEPPARRRFRPSNRTITAFCAVTAATFLASAAAPTPLYQHYQSAFGLGSGALTLIFAAYAFSLLAALLTVGALSDHVGRRPAILTATVINMAAMLLFMTAHSAFGLGLARMVQGFGTGMATTALGAAILDVDRKRGPLLNSVTAFIGLFFGALGSGLLVHWAPAPTQLVYAVLLIMSAAQTVLAIGMPETASRRPGALRSLLPELRMPKTARHSFIHVSPVNIAGWALGGLNFSLMPALVGLAEGRNEPLTGTLVVATLMAGATLAVLGLRRFAAEHALIAGAMALSLGMALALCALSLPSVTVMFAGVALAGVGFGASFSGAFRELLPRAESHDRAGLLSTFYIESYLAFSLPVILAGLAILQLGLAETATIYGEAIIVLALISAGVFWRRLLKGGFQNRYPMVTPPETR